MFAPHGCSPVWRASASPEDRGAARPAIGLHSCRGAPALIVKGVPMCAPRSCGPVQAVVYVSGPASGVPRAGAPPRRGFRCRWRTRTGACWAEAPPNNGLETDGRGPGRVLASRAARQRSTLVGRRWRRASTAAAAQTAIRYAVLLLPECSIIGLPPRDRVNFLPSFSCATRMPHDTAEGAQRFPYFRQLNTPLPALACIDADALLATISGPPGVNENRLEGAVGLQVPPGQSNRARSYQAPEWTRFWLGHG